MQLADLSNLFFVTGVFPSILRTVKVVPVFKKDSKLDYSNYHSIFLSSNIEKILEKLKYIKLYTFFNNNNITSNLQCGFRQHYSVLNVLINITQNIRKALDEGNIGCDLQKAFDHQIYQQKWIIMRFMELPVTNLNHICLIAINMYT